MLIVMNIGARGVGWGVEKSNRQTNPLASDGNYCNIYSSYKFHPYSRLVCRQKYISHSPYPKTEY